jgi:hypothetical protein
MTYRRLLLAGLTVAAMPMTVHAESAAVPDISDQIYAQWNQPNKPNDGVIEATFSAGGDPRGCKIVASKGPKGCMAVRCKGEAPVIANSAVSLEGAMRRAENQAYKRLAEFLEVGIKSKEATKELQEESAVDGVESSNFASSTQTTITREANQILSGAVTLADGVADKGGRKTAYSVIGQSCLTQNAAGQLKSGNAANAGPNPTGPGKSAGPGRAPSSGGTSSDHPPVQSFERQNNGDF